MQEMKDSFFSWLGKETWIGTNLNNWGKKYKKKDQNGGVTEDEMYFIISTKKKEKRKKDKTIL